MGFDVKLNDVPYLLNSIDSEIIALANIIRNQLFSEDEQAYSLYDIPCWVMNAGHSPESAMNRTCFEKLVKTNKSSFINKSLYYYDCDALLFGLQNRYTAIGTLINEVYKQLSCHIEINLHDLNAVILSDSTSIHTHACMNSIFINLASSCDLMTKVAIELESIPKLCFSTYPKMKSTNITYGDKTKLPNDLKKDDTYFARTRPVPIAIVESLRDEIIHNGSLDINYNVYSAMYNDEIYDWIPFPAFTENGTFETYNGRKKFYENSDRTFNEELPKIVGDFLVLAINTLKLLNQTFKT